MTGPGLRITLGNGATGATLQNGRGHFTGGSIEDDVFVRKKCSGTVLYGHDDLKEPHNYERKVWFWGMHDDLYLSEHKDNDDSE